jgi:hypothetical protein
MNEGRQKRDEKKPIRSEGLFREVVVEKVTGDKSRERFCERTQSEKLTRDSILQKPDRETGNGCLQLATRHSNVNDPNEQHIRQKSADGKKRDESRLQEKQNENREDRSNIMFHERPL